MEFGVYHEFPSLDGQPDTLAFDHAFDLVEASEKMILKGLTTDTCIKLLTSAIPVTDAELGVAAYGSGGSTIYGSNGNPPASLDRLDHRHGL